MKKSNINNNNTETLGCFAWIIELLRIIIVKFNLLTYLRWKVFLFILFYSFASSPM